MNKPTRAAEVFQRMLLALAALLAFAPARAAAAQIVDARPYLDPTRPDFGIQRAIDAVSAAGGGAVVLPAGVFTLETFLQLPSGVTLRGQGAATILAAGRNEQRVAVTAGAAGGSTSAVEVADAARLRAGMTVYLWQSNDLNFWPASFTIRGVDAAARRISLDRVVPYELRAGESQVGFGLYTRLVEKINGRDSIVRAIKVADPSLFRVGEAIAIKVDANGSDPFLDPPGGQWGVEQNRITAIDAASGTLTLARRVTLNAYAGAVVAHGYSAILAQRDPDGAPPDAIGIEDLAIQGWATPAKPAFHEFYLGAISLVECVNAHIRDVSVSDWHSDGVSIQACGGVQVTDVTSARNRGNGFHPGTASSNVELLRVRAVGNLGQAWRGTNGDGLYYCWSNRAVNIHQSVFVGNAGSGIGDVGGGENGATSPDTNLLIEDNLVARNGRAGIEVNGGGSASGTVIRRNVVRDNATRGGDYAGIDIRGRRGAAGGYTVDGNLVESTVAPATQLYGIRESDAGGYAADRNSLTDNVVRGHLGGDVVATGSHTQVAGNSAGATGATPGTPTELVATPASGGIALRWNTSANGGSYQIKRRAGASGGFVALATAAGTSAETAGYADGSARAGRYCYVVVARGAGGSSGDSNEACASVGPQKVFAPLVSR